MNDRYKLKVFNIALGLILASCTVPTPSTPTLALIATETPPPPTNIVPPSATSTATPTFVPTPTPIPPLIDSMGKLNWRLGFCDEQCGGSNGSSSITDLILIPDRTDNPDSALEISYEIKKDGWVLITRNIDPKILSGTIGISFFYKGSGAPNTIELKLLLRYPGDTVDTVFGASWNRATDTNGNWAQIEALYNQDFTCWWPQNLCQIHGNILDLTAVQTIDLAISNKPVDEAGSGKAAFDDLAGIEP